MYKPKAQLNLAIFSFHAAGFHLDLFITALKLLPLNVQVRESALELTCSRLIISLQEDQSYFSSCPDPNGTNGILRMMSVPRSNGLMRCRDGYPEESGKMDCRVEQMIHHQLQLLSKEKIMAINKFIQTTNTMDRQTKG